MKNLEDPNQIGWELDNSYTSLPDKFFSRNKADSVRSPKIVAFNTSLAGYLGLNEKELNNSYGAAIFTGNDIPPGSKPLAQAYAGHQFGHFTMLGDGRAILLGEQMTPSGKQYDVQLKGSGRTPYSRGGDGRATLGPMLREYIISEAMHGLGIPTTRSLAVVTTGETVMREKPLPGAILTRIAASHIRVGTFQYAANWGTKEELRSLTDYTISRHYPELAANDNPYRLFLENVIERQASLIAKWQLVGFIHGVMNTDNMTISGETIDYGPCAFMDEYNPATVFSSIDKQGRYAYGNQPRIGVWNLTRFAEALVPLLHENKNKAIEIAEDTLSNYSSLYHEYWLSGARKKLGILNEEEEDKALIESLYELMEKYNADYTNTFRGLTVNRIADIGLLDKEDFKIWFGEWKERLRRQKESEEVSLEVMRNNNPAVIPRNHRVEEALEAAVEQSDYSVMGRLLKVLANPYTYATEQEEYAKPPEPSNQPYQTYCGT
ncbi:protein adenylyltransferase SelO [Ornithinibacillus xuwenensis]|uniref:Protein nucleotidyltransferase YdiU n=1 Tax=Ornithinibacillus xuwenensis TaxID=3144668 RepID=A0ABU9XI98_9BACI